jgi:hypothetical protein
MNLSCVFLLAANLVQQQVESPPFFKDNQQRMMTYYRAKDPSLGPKLLADLLQKKNVDSSWFEGKEHVLMILGSQLGDIVTGNPKLVREYEAALANASPAGKRVVIRALMNCGDAETVKKIDGWLADKHLADARPQLEELKKHLEDPKRSHVRDRPAKTPDDLDLLWANFFTTAEYAPISRILDVFDQPDAPENETMKRVAKWSLGSNLQQHPKLVEIVQQHAKERPEGSRKVIDQLIIKQPDPNKP